MWNSPMTTGFSSGRSLSNELGLHPQRIRKEPLEPPWSRCSAIGTRVISRPARSWILIVRRIRRRWTRARYPHRGGPIIPQCSGADTSHLPPEVLYALRTRNARGSRHIMGARSNTSGACSSGNAMGLTAETTGTARRRRDSSRLRSTISVRVWWVRPTSRLFPGRAEPPEVLRYRASQFEVSLPGGRVQATEVDVGTLGQMRIERDEMDRAAT